MGAEGAESCRRRWPKVACITGAVLLALIVSLILLPEFIDVGAFKRSYLPLVEEALHRRVDVDQVRLSFLPAPSIRVARLKLSDNPAFSATPFFTVEELQLRLRLWPLLRGRFEATEFVLEKPAINLLKRADGSLSYSELAGKKIAVAKKAEVKKNRPAQRPQDSTTLPLIIPGRLRIRDGQLTLQTQSETPVTLTGINLSLQDVSSEQPFPYRASITYPGLKTIALEGQLSYSEEHSTLKLKDNRLKVQDLVLPVEGSISQLSSSPRFTLTSEAERVETKALLHVLSAFGLGSSDMEVSGPIGLRLSLTGPFDRLVAELRAQFEDLNLNAQRALKGNFAGTIVLKVPVGRGTLTQALEGSGNLVGRDGELTNVDLVNRIQRVTSLIGFSQTERREATRFKTLEAEFAILSGLAEFNQITLLNPQIEARGQGTMTLKEPKLNLAIEAKLANSGLARAATGKTATLFKDSQGRIVVPLKITGRIEKPAVNLDSDKLWEKGISGSAEKSMSTWLRQFFRSK